AVLVPSRDGAEAHAQRIISGERISDRSTSERESGDQLSGPRIGPISAPSIHKAETLGSNIQAGVPLAIRHETFPTLKDVIAIPGYMGLLKSFDPQSRIL